MEKAAEYEASQCVLFKKYVRYQIEDNVVEGRSTHVRYKNSIHNLRQKIRRDHFGIVRENGRTIKMGFTQTGPEDTGLVLGYYEQGYEP
jgi:hypothetical protein